MFALFFSLSIFSFFINKKKFEIRNYLKLKILIKNIKWQTNQEKNK